VASCEQVHRDERNHHEDRNACAGPNGQRGDGASELVLPPSVQAALGELVNAAKDGLLALSVGVGLGVLHELMETEVDEVVGPKGQHDAARTAVRHGHEAGGGHARRAGGLVCSVLGSGRRTTARRSSSAPTSISRRAIRCRGWCSSRCSPAFRPLGCRTREPVGEPVTAVERSVSKSAVSRAFVAKTSENLELLMSRSLADVRLAVLMIDGIDLQGRTNVVALGTSTDGVKTPLGLWEGSSEDAAVATALLADLVTRGLDVEQGVLCVLDGSKTLRKAVRDVLGTHTPVQRCVRHYPDLRVMPTGVDDRPQVARLAA
jgi:putative transposase